MEIHLFVSLLLIGGNAAAGIDLTRWEEGKGPSVVQSVVDVIRENCIIQSDRMFLTRLAVIQSNDGLHPKTYREGYHGGIWQVDEDKYNSIRNCSDLTLADVCDTIQTKLNINWAESEWRDLRKPLYSGIAASLYIRLNHPRAIPGNPRLQARIWTELFDPTGDVDTYVTLARDQMTDEYCERPIDLAFIIDASASVTSENFDKMKKFMIKVTEGLRIGGDAAQIATVTFETYAIVNFKLSDYDTAEKIKEVIASLPYAGGWTSTDLGLRLAASDVFVPEGGTRENAAKVALVITDGESNDGSDTAEAAQRLRDKGVLIFSIGVGNININELNDIATDPDCYHVFILEDFTEITDIINEIQKSACRAQVSFTAESNDEEVISKEIPFVGNETEVNLVIPAAPPSENSTNTTTFVTDVSCGVVYIYASYDTTHPNEAVYTFNDVATNGTASVMSIKEEGQRPLYVTYKGKKYRSTNATLDLKCDIKSSVYQGEAPKTDVVCLKDGEEKPCDPGYFRSSGHSNFVKGDSDIPAYLCDEFPGKFLVHPLDGTKFIRCSADRGMFVMQCPGGESYHGDTFTCGDSNRVPRGLLVPVLTKKKKKIVVDQRLKSIQQLFLTAVKTIEENQEQNSPKVVCRSQNQIRPCDYFALRTSNYSSLLTKDSWTGAPNPCDPDKELNEQQRVIHKNDLDPTKFITCTEGGVMYVGQCPRGQRFVEENITCKKQTEPGA